MKAKAKAIVPIESTYRRREPETGTVGFERLGEAGKSWERCKARRPEANNAYTLEYYTIVVITHTTLYVSAGFQMVEARKMGASDSPENRPISSIIRAARLQPRDPVTYEHICHLHRSNSPPE